jgi:hypothetical protein
LITDGVKGFDIPWTKWKGLFVSIKRYIHRDIDFIPGSGGDLHGAQTGEVDDNGGPRRTGTINGGLFW